MFLAIPTKIMEAEEILSSDRAKNYGKRLTDTGHYAFMIASDRPVRCSFGIWISGGRPQRPPRL